MPGWLTALLKWGGSAVTIISVIAAGLRGSRLAPTRGRLDSRGHAYDALCGAYRGGFGRRHNWLVVGLIEITAQQSLRASSSRRGSVCPTDLDGLPHFMAW